MKRVPFMVFVLILFFAMSGLMMRYFATLDISGTSFALDWDLLWGAMEGGTLNYGPDGPHYPPWAMLIMIPFGLLPFQTSWGLYIFFMLMFAIVSVPAGRYRIWAILLAALSYPLLRTGIDGNFEAVVTLGVWLLVMGYTDKRAWLVAAGVILVTLKPQSAILLVLVTGIYMLKTWPMRHYLTAAGMVLAVVIPALIWRGNDWLTSLLMMQQPGSIMDSSLQAAITRLDIVPLWFVWIFRVAIIGVTLWVMWRGEHTLTREKAALLVAAGLLIAPYSAGNSALTVYLIGIIPLFQKRLLMGGLLVLMTNVPYLMLSQREFMFNYSAYYWTLYFLLAWALMLIYTYRRDTLLKDSA